MLPDDFCAVATGRAWTARARWPRCHDGVLLVCFGPSAAAQEVLDHDAVGDAVHELAPEVEIVAVHARDWRARPYSRETWSFLRPGQVHSAWSALRAPEGRVHFAGAHNALRWPSFMDGALESGFRVAEEISGPPA